MAQTEARNRQDLERALSAVTSELLNEKGYICFVDVLMKLGYLSKSDYENWRLKRVSPLERVLNVNLSRINFIMKTVRRNSLNDCLQELQRGGIAPDSVHECGNMKRLYADFHRDATSCVIQDRARHAVFFMRPEKMIKTTKKTSIRRFQ